MEKIRFEDLPGPIQSIFSTVRRQCVCRVRGGLKEGTERYYVTCRGETTVFAYRDGVWAAIRTY